MHWSAMSSQEVVKKLGSSQLKGLGENTAVKRRRTVKPIDKTSASVGLVRIVLHQFMSPLVYLLIVAALISISIGRVKDVYFILAIIVANAIFGSIQERKADTALKALHKIAPDKSLVVRNGDVVEIDTSLIVPGDIVVITEGTRVPADLRILSAHDLEINEASLTGESMPVHKTAEVIPMPGNRTVAQKNIAFYGSLVTQGHGRGIVIAAGADVRFAKVLHKASSQQDEKTPLENEVKVLARIVLVVAAVLALLVFIVFLTKGLSIRESFVYLISLFVAVVPEGLPIVVTLTLAVAAARMARQKVITRRLIAADILGNIDVVLTDKTGTITTGNMSVRKIWLGGMTFDVGGQKRLQLRNNEAVNKDDMQQLLTAAVVANNAKLIYGLKNNKNVGDGVELSLLSLADRLGFSQRGGKWQRIDEVAFSSQRKVMAILAESGKNRKIFAKGAPEIVVSRASKILYKGRVVKLSQAIKDSFNAEYLKLARYGYRVIALAAKKTTAKNQKIEYNDIKDLTILGIVAIEDAARDGVAPTIAELEDAGIEIKLVTGDHASTAFSVAKSVGIAKEKDFIVTGKRLSGLLASHRNDILNNARIFARMEPEDKLELVKYYRQKGLRVAFAGDGVNDAAAIKSANVGIALAGEGGDVAQQTADIVLLDNNFNVLASGLREGRTVWQNLRKVVFFLLSTNIAEFMVIFGAVILALPSPFSAVQILWINLVTDTVADEALALEPTEQNMYRLKSRHLLSPVVARRIIVAAIWQIAVIMTFYIWALNNLGAQQASSFAFVALVIMQIFNLFNARSITESIFARGRQPNYWVWASIVLTVVLLFASLYFAPLSNFLGLVPIQAKYFIIIAMIGLSIIGVVEVDKLISLSVNKKHGTR